MPVRSARNGNHGPDSARHSRAFNGGRPIHPRRLVSFFICHITFVLCHCRDGAASGNDNCSMNNGKCAPQNLCLTAHQKDTNLCIRHVQCSTTTHQPLTADAPAIRMKPRVDDPAQEWRRWLSICMTFDRSV